MQRSVTSPPLLESYNKHPLSSFDNNKPSFEEKNGASNRREEIHITAEVHDQTNTRQTHSPRRVNAPLIEGAYSPKHQRDASGSSDKPAQLLSIAPSASEASDGGVNDTEEEERGKSFILKFSDL